jgi:hypothetical protein
LLSINANNNIDVEVFNPVPLDSDPTKHWLGECKYIIDFCNKKGINTNVSGNTIRKGLKLTGELIKANYNICFLRLKVAVAYAPYFE